MVNFETKCSCIFYVHLQWFFFSQYLLPCRSRGTNMIVNTLSIMSLSLFLLLFVVIMLTIFTLSKHVAAYTLVMIIIIISSSLSLTKNVTGVCPLFSVSQRHFLIFNQLSFQDHAKNRPLIITVNSYYLESFHHPDRAIVSISLHCLTQMRSKSVSCFSYSNSFLGIAIAARC